MAIIFPFKGIRYNTKKIKNISATISPPYDVISDKEEKWLRRFPYNIIHIELPKGTGGTGFQPVKTDRYQKAAQKLSLWQKKNILIRDSEPLFYVYEQIFNLEGKTYQRRGIFVSLKIEPWRKTVKPHEKTLSKPKEDRLNLLKACQTNISPIFGLFSDTSKAFQKIVTKITQQKPEIKIRDYQNIQHRLWVLKDKTIQKRIQKLLKPKPIFIADGHHRYEVSLEYARVMKKDNFWRTLMYLCPLEDEGLIILPTHRQVVVSPKFDLKNFLSLVEKNFSIRTFSDSEKMLRLVNKSRYSYGFYIGGKEYYLLTYKKKTSQLAVELVHQLLINPIAEKITYTKNAREAIIFARQSPRQSAFFLPPTPIEAIKKTALAGKTMPQKSTYFYPKLATGIVLHPLF